MPDRENVIKALSICVPETQDDSKLECSDCPYGDICNPNDIVGITLALIWDIRALLKEQEPVEPEVEVLNEIDRLYKCSKCHKHFFYRKQKYCDQCGQAVKWE